MRLNRRIAMVAASGIVAGALPLLAQSPVAHAAGPPSGVAGVRGADNALWVNFGGGWQSYGGQMIAAPALVGFNGTTAYVTTAPDHTLWERTDAEGWRLLSSGNPHCLDTPAVDVTGSTFTVACAGTDRQLWYAQSNIAGMTSPWVGGFSSLGGTLVSGPAVATVEGRLTFAVDAPGQQVWLRTDTSGFVDTPWHCVGHPTLGANGARSYFGCRGADDALWYAQNGGSGWTPAASAGGRLLGGAGLLSVPGGAFLYAEGTDHALYRTELLDNAGTTAWSDLYGTVGLGGVGGQPNLFYVPFAASDGLGNPGCQVPQYSVPALGKAILMSLNCQLLVAYSDGNMVLWSYTTTGRPERPTPRGFFSVIRKNHPWQMVSGDSTSSPLWYPPTYVQYVVWFTNQGHGIHDANWEPNSALGPGSQYNPSIASHGCVHMNTNLVGSLYSWADLGTPVWIF